MKIDPLKAGIGAVLLTGGGWIALRLYQRSKLVGLLEKSAMVNQAMAGGVVAWTVEEKAAEVIAFTNTMTADQGYALVLAELRKLIPLDAGDMVDLTEDAKRLFLEQTGIDPDAVIKASGDAATKLTEATKGYAQAAYQWLVS